MLNLRLEGDALWETGGLSSASSTLNSTSHWVLGVTVPYDLTETHRQKLRLATSLFRSLREARSSMIGMGWRCRSWPEPSAPEPGRHTVRFLSEQIGDEVVKQIKILREILLGGEDWFVWLFGFRIQDLFRAVRLGLPPELGRLDDAAEEALHTCVYD